MSATTSKIELPAYVAALFSKKGATGADLNAFLGRKYEPTAMQLRPVAARYNAELLVLPKDKKNPRVRYAFKKLPKTGPAKNKARSAKK